MVGVSQYFERLARAYLERRAAQPAPAQGPTGPGAPALISGNPGWPTSHQSGAQALRSSAVWSCCNIITKAISTLPTDLLQKTSTGRAPALTHPYYRMLTSAPNPMMTLQQWIQPTLLHLLLWGNAFTYVDSIDGEVVGLWPLQPDRMRIVYTGNQTVQYTYFDYRGQAHRYTPGVDLIPFRLFSLDGYIGLSVLQYQALSLDFQDLSSDYMLSLYRNGGRPSGVLEYPKPLNKPQVDKIRESWASIHGGARGAGQVAVLDDGTKYNPVGIPPESLQYIETQQFSIRQIARIFGVAPHLIGADDHPTYASVEQQSIEFLRYTISPYVKVLETSLDSALLEEPYFYKFNLNAFERSDIRTRYLAYATARQWGWLNVNDIRDREDLNSIGDQGDVYLQPMNMISADAAAALAAADPNAPAPQASPSTAQPPPTPGGLTQIPTEPQFP